MEKTSKFLLRHILPIQMSVLHNFILDERDGTMSMRMSNGTQVIDADFNPLLTDAQTALCYPS